MIPFYRGGKLRHTQKHSHHKISNSTFEAKDLVCGMNVKSAKINYKYSEDEYYFCSTKCKTKFDAAPTEFVGCNNNSLKTEIPTNGVICTCPMHPQIQQSLPGNCPICGMTLEPDGIEPRRHGRKL